MCFVLDKLVGLFFSYSVEPEGELGHWDRLYRTYFNDKYCEGFVLGMNCAFCVEQSCGPIFLIFI